MTLFGCERGGVSSEAGERGNAVLCGWEFTAVEAIDALVVRGTAKGLDLAWDDVRLRLSPGAFVVTLRDTPGQEATPANGTADLGDLSDAPLQEGDVLRFCAAGGGPVAGVEVELWQERYESLRGNVALVFGFAEVAGCRTHP